MQRTISKVLSLILALTMIITLLPIGVLATAPPPATTTPTPVAENGTAGNPYPITAPAQIYALARILTKAPTSDSISDELKADYKSYGIESAFAAGFAKLQTAHYQLQNAIALTNHTDTATNNFVGIPNFAGHFDGNNNTITITIIIDKYPTKSTDNFYGGLFSTLINGAVVENITFDGTVTAGTADAYFSTPGFRFGTLFGVIPIAEDQRTAISNITNNAAITMYLTGTCGVNAGGIGGLGGYHTGESFTDCTNNGNINIYTKDITGSPRFGGMVGSGCKGNSLWIRCVNNGDIIADGTGTGAYCVGDMVGSGGGAVFINCVSAGKLQSVNAFSKIFEGITAAGQGNVIRLSFTGGTAGDVLSYSKDPSIKATVASDGTAALDIPIFVNAGGSYVNQKFDAKNYIQVNGTGAIYYFDGDSKMLTTDLIAQAGAVIEAPFSTEEKALQISEPQHLLWLQKAINQDDKDAMDSLMALACLSKPKDAAAYVVVRSALNSGFIKLTDNITFTKDIGFTGIGTSGMRYEGSIDGNGHTLAYTINHKFVKGSPLFFGLIGHMGVSCSIKNITVEPTITVTGNGTEAIYIGGIVAYSAGGSPQIGENVVVNVKGITSDAVSNSGGAFGSVYNITGAPTIRLQGDIQGYHSGGVAGVASGNTDLNGMTLAGAKTCKISGSGYAGGLIGYYQGAESMTLNSIHSDNALFSIESTGENGFAGALFGRTDRATVSISGYKNQIPVTSVGTAGGIIGSVSGAASTPVTLTDCENLAAINGAIAGGLIGYLSSGTASITDCCNYGTLTGTNPGGLIGYNTGTVTFQNAAYLKTGTIKNAVYNVPTDAAGVIALDTTKIPATATYGDSIQFLTAAPPAQLTILPADSVSVDGTGKLTFTKAGDVVVSAKWNGTEIYNSGTITVAQKDITASAAILDVLSAYPHTGSAVTPVPTVKDADTALTLGTDYTLGYSDNTAAGTATITVTFKGNYTGTASKNFTIDPNALAVTSADYTGVYDGQEHKITVTAPEGATISYCTTESGTYGEHPVLKNVASAKVYFKVEKPSHTTVTGSQIVTITPAPLTITAKSYYIYVGGTAPTTYEYTVTGLVGDEKLTAEPTGTCTPDVLKVGTYPITIAGAAVTTPANYVITYVPGSLNVMYYIDEPRTAVSSGSEIYTGDLQRLAAQNKDFTVTGDNGAALKFNPEALKELAKNGGKITVTISDAGDRLSEAQKKIAGNRPVFDLTVMCGKTVISDFGGGSVQVSLPYTLKDGEDPDLVCVWNLAEDGTLTRVSGRYDPISKTIVFTTAHFSQYVVGKWVNHFADVSESAWYYGSVAKMNALGLMNGTDAKTFSAGTKATRSMLLSMLYRMAGSPEAIPASGAWYGRALSWALGSGISDGTNPDGDISREELVTILWRYAGSPKTGGNISRFADAASVAGYAKDAMAWAVESGLLIGSEGKLLPNGCAYRAQVAAVLSRYIDTLAK